MLEFGARFSNDFYIKVSVKEDLSESSVTVETIVEGEPVVNTGSITWSEANNG